jgi:hypothetical protein
VFVGFFVFLVLCFVPKCLSFFVFCPTGILDFIWSATDKDGSGTIDKEEYMVMCRKVYRAIVDDTNSPEADAEIRKIAEEDWDVDRQGHDHLDYERFTRAWFQLADHWTHDLSADSYETFLSNIFTSLTERDKDGNIVWRDDRDIHHYDPEATEEEQNTLVEAGFQDIVGEVKKKKKKKRNTYMDADAMEKYRQRMANKKKKNRGVAMLLWCKRANSREIPSLPKYLPVMVCTLDLLSHRQKILTMCIPIQMFGSLHL